MSIMKLNVDHMQMLFNQASIKCHVHVNKSKEF